MVDLAAVFGRFAKSYLDAYGVSMPPSHHRAIADILACRTAVLGGQLWRCDGCGTDVPVYHSCRNRSCPTCHGAQTDAWLAKRRDELLPVPHFHVTVTVPAELRAVLRRRQREGYGALIKAAASAIVDLARDLQWIGGTPGVLAVFHSWTQKLDYHPHGHRQPAHAPDRPGGRSDRPDHPDARWPADRPDPHRRGCSRRLLPHDRDGRIAGSAFFLITLGVSP